MGRVAVPRALGSCCGQLVDQDPPPTSPHPRPASSLLVPGTRVNLESRDRVQMLSPRCREQGSRPFLELLLLLPACLFSKTPFPSSFLPLSLHLFSLLA